MGSLFWDDWMRLENGEDFHKALLPARDRICGVFSGHVHQNTDIIRDGITYFTSKSSWYQLYNYPHQEKPEPDRFADPGYSIVIVTRDQTYVRRCTFRVDPVLDGLARSAATIPAIRSMKVCSAGSSARAVSGTFGRRSARSSANGSVTNGLSAVSTFRRWARSS